MKMFRTLIITVLSMLVAAALYWIDGGEFIRSPNLALTLGFSGFIGAMLAAIIEENKK